MLWSETVFSALSSSEVVDCQHLKKRVVAAAAVDKDWSTCWFCWLPNAFVATVFCSFCFLNFVFFAGAELNY